MTRALAIAAAVLMLAACAPVQMSSHPAPVADPAASSGEAEARRVVTEILDRRDSVLGGNVLVAGRKGWVLPNWVKSVSFAGDRLVIRHGKGEIDLRIADLPEIAVLEYGNWIGQSLYGVAVTKEEVLWTVHGRKGEAERLAGALASLRQMHLAGRAAPPGDAAGGPVVATQPSGGSPPRPSDVTITLSHPAEGARVPDEVIQIAGLVTTSKVLERLELLVNGRPVPVSRDVRAQGADVQNHSFSARLPLEPGQNLIAVTVVDAAGRAAQAVRTVFREAAGVAVVAPARTGERWAVIIGIDRYQDPSISTLGYATADAEAVFKFLTTKGGVKPNNARLLINQQATQRAVREVLGDFLRQKALKEDEVIIYYAGHGTTEPDASADGGLAKYLVPWDADPEKLFSTAIPMEEIDRIFGRLSARKILMVQDTCFSGGAGGRTFRAKGLAVRSSTLTDKFLQDLSQKEGRMILTASDVNQVSQEDPALRHGIFTHFLLEALNGAADLDGDGAITVREVHLYLQRRVHERSNGAQTPQLYNVGDMVLTQKQTGAR
jgi:hypothetical protein